MPIKHIARSGNANAAARGHYATCSNRPSVLSRKAVCCSRALKQALSGSPGRPLSCKLQATYTQAVALICYLYRSNSIHILPTLKPALTGNPGRPLCCKASKCTFMLTTVWLSQVRR